MRAALVLLALCVATPAHADKADKLFKKGKKQLAAKKYAQACATFVEVDGLDPGIGAKLNVARCYEEWGRLATAYRWYVDAQEMASSSGDTRLAKIKELVEELDFNVPRLTLKVPDNADEDVVATITFDGKPLTEGWLGTPQRVNPGTHVIEFVVEGKQKKKTVPLERAAESEVTLPIPPGSGKPKAGGKGKDKPGPGDPPSVATGPRPGRTQRIAGISLVAGGGVAVVAAAVITVGARGDYKDALDAHCMGSTTMCDPDGLRITRDARRTANIATVITIAGGAAVAGGIVLYMLAPRAASSKEHALYVVPTVGDGGGVVFGGRF